MKSSSICQWRWCDRSCQSSNGQRGRPWSCRGRRLGTLFVDEWSCRYRRPCSTWELGASPSFSCACSSWGWCTASSCASYHHHEGEGPSGGLIPEFSLAWALFLFLRQQWDQLNPSFGNYDREGKTKKYLVGVLLVCSHHRQKEDSVYLLDIVIRQGATILELFTGEDQTLLIWGDALLV